MKWQRWDDERKERFRKLWESGAKAQAIADELETSRGAIYLQRAKQGLPPRDTNTLGAATARPRDTTKQRRFAGLDIDRAQRQVRKLRTEHPALRSGNTIYGSQVVNALDHRRLIKSGRENRKTGALAVKGRWRGMPIYTLTLEERATCPRDCAVWDTCYGNNMGMAPRVHDDGWLKTRLWIELHALNAEHPQGFIMRLHILGDFFSVDYVRFWDDALVCFPALRIFGFTARKPDTDIGRALVHLMADHVERVAMRWSGVDLPLHTSEVVASRDLATGIICPAQTDAKRSCATCGLCWQSERKITFIEH